MLPTSEICKLIRIPITDFGLGPHPLYLAFSEVLNLITPCPNFNRVLVIIIIITYISDCTVLYIDYKKYISHYGNLGLQEKLIAVWISWVPWAFLLGH